MIHLNREPNLFTEKNIDRIFLESERNIKNKIDSYSNYDLTTMNAKKEVEKLIKNENLDVPKLILTEKKKPSIIERGYFGQDLPSPSTYIENKKYIIEFVIRKVPYNGNSIFFDYSLPTTKRIFHKIEVLSNYIKIEQTNWRQGIIDNKEGIEKLNNEFKNILNLIDTNLIELDNFTQDKRNSLQNLIYNYFEIKKENVLKLNRNIEKLNEY